MSNLRAQLIIREQMLKAIEDIREAIETENPTGYGPPDASGQSKNSLKYKSLEDGDRYQLVSDMPGQETNYILTLETGRGPTKGGSGSGGGPSLKESILDWIRIKGIQPNDGISEESLAFLIARKIHREGTRLHKQGGKSGILSRVTAPDQVAERFIKPIERALIQEIKTVIQ